MALAAAACTAPDPVLEKGLHDVASRPAAARVSLRPYALAGQAQAVAPICVAYGTSMDSEVPEVERQQAFAWCLQSARAGHLASQYHLGRFYQSGIGTPVDPAAALQWFKQAAERGHRGATDAARGMEGQAAVCRNLVTNCKMF